MASSPPLLELKWDGSFLHGIDGTNSLSDWVVPEEGINLQGGIATLRLTPHHKPERVVMKRLKKLDVLRAVVCDRFKKHFPSGPQTTGSHYARIMFAGTFTLQRTLRASGKMETVQVAPNDEAHWFLILRYIDAPVLRSFVTSAYHLGSPPKTLWLPEKFADGDAADQFMLAFSATFAYRLMLGVTDPGPGNFLVKKVVRVEKGERYDLITGSPVIYSLDEGSAFSDKLKPGIDKTWLDSNLGKTKQSTLATERLGKYTNHVYGLVDKWLAQPLVAGLRVELNDMGELTDTQKEDMIHYVTQNLTSLKNDWDRYVNNPPSPSAFSSPSSSPPRPSSPSVHVTFGADDLKQSYHRSTFGAPGNAYSNAEITSLLQKAIRRNLPVLAQFSAAMLLVSLQVTKLCNRLMTIATEDIGIGNLHCTELAVQLHMLKEQLYSSEKVPSPNGDVAAWRRDLRNSEEFRTKLWQCVHEMCISPKTRIGDHMSMVLLGQNTALDPLDRPAIKGAFLDVLAHRGAYAKEEGLMRQLARHLDPSNLPLARKNILTICDEALSALADEKELPSGEFIYYKQAMEYCKRTIEARNETKPTKLAGKTSLATIVLMCSRPRHQINLYLPAGTLGRGIPYCPQVYGDILKGTNLPSIPAYAKDKHTTYIPGGNELFLRTEIKALTPEHQPCPDPYYERALTRAVQKDVIESQGRSSGTDYKKRKSTAKVTPGKKTRV